MCRTERVFVVPEELSSWCNTRVMTYVTGHIYHDLCVHTLALFVNCIRPRYDSRPSGGRLKDVQFFFRFDSHSSPSWRLSPLLCKRTWYRSFGLFLSVTKGRSPLSENRRVSHKLLRLSITSIKKSHESRSQRFMTTYMDLSNLSRPLVQCHRVPTSPTSNEKEPVTGRVRTSLHESGNGDSSKLEKGRERRLLP